MRHLSRVIALFVLIALSSILVSAHAQPPEVEPAAASDANGSSPSPGYAPDRLLVKFHTEATPARRADGTWRTGRAPLDELLVKSKVQTVASLFPPDRSRSTADTVGLERIYVLRLAPGSDVEQMVQSLAADPAVEWAEPDYLAYPAATTPNDPLFPEQWGLTKIDAPAAWDVITGSAVVPIAVVDSGIDLTHPDLASKLWVNPGEIAGNGLDDDNNGYIDDVNGWDLVNGDNDPTDDYGHGTQVAGVAAAATNNGIGGAGVCWGCRVMPVKVMQASGVANYSDIAQGVLYSAQKGAKVINLSLGGRSDSATLRTAIQAAAGTYGAVVVAGAGNDNTSEPFYPAAYPEALAVAGTDRSDIKALFSDRGLWVDVSGPAVAITTTFMGGDWGPADGTSFATALVSGLAGLLRSQHPDWSQSMVSAQIVHTADPIDVLNPGFEGQLGSGRVNANQSISVTAQPLLAYQSYTVDGVATGRPAPGSTVDLDVILYNDWADASGVQATLSSSDSYVTIVNDTAWLGDIPAYGNGTNTTPFRFSVSASAPYGHNMNFALEVTASGEYSANIPLIIQTASSVVYPPATITTRTWTNDRVYVINKETGVPAGNTLTIEQGTEIRFDGNYSLSVAGTLIADGLEEQPILFTSNKADPSPGDWGRIKFLDSSVDATFDSSGNYIEGSILRHAIIEYGAGLLLENAAPSVTHNTFNFDVGMVIDGVGSPGLVISYNEIAHLDDASYGIQLSGVDFRIVENIVKGGMVGLSISGPGMIADNVVSDVLHWGILAQDVLTVTANRVTNCDEGISANGGIISANLVAYNGSNGLHIDSGTPTVISNTIVSNGQAGIYIAGGTPDIRHNNLIAGPGGHALRITTADNVAATNNWWGTTDESGIQEAIYDGMDEYGLGFVDYSSYLVNPEQTAPAYVTDVYISPDTTLGIQTAIFEVRFSRKMEQDSAVDLSFASVKNGTWTVYDASNSGLPDDSVYAIATDLDGSHWFGAHSGGVAHFDDTNWTVYNMANSGLPYDAVYAIAVDIDGSHWFGTDSGGVAHFDGTNWTVYNTANSGLPWNNIAEIAIDPDGSYWFGTDFGVATGGVAHFDGTNWTMYDASNSGLPDDYVGDIAADPDASRWFGTHSGVAHFDGMNWTVYNTANSGLPGNEVSAIATDPDGSHWFGTWDGGVAHFDDTNWTVYNAANSGLPYDAVYAIATDPDGSHWFGTLGGVAHFDGTSWTVYNTTNSGLPHDHVPTIATDPDGSRWFGTLSGLAALWNYPAHVVGNSGQWLDDSTYHATYDITSLIPRGDYLVSILGAIGTDGVEIAPTVGYTFTVDYAGAIGDTTQPPVPAVEACASTDVGTLSASWSAYDPDSAIMLYRYAIGTTPGGTEVINWTNTSDSSFTRTGLSLIVGQLYYVAVKARNEGGLWSEAGIPDGIVAGSGTCTTNNEPPVANAGTDRIVLVNELVTLDGGGSTDPDGHVPLFYSWQQTTGPAVTLSGPTTRQPIFTAPANPAVLTFSLVVTDAYGLAALTPDGVVITVTEPENWHVYLPIVLRGH